MHFKEIQEEGILGTQIERPRERIFSLKLDINIETEHKSAQEEALFSVYEQALLSGCGAYSRQEFLDAVNLLGASISVQTSGGLLSISALCRSESSAKLLELLCTMLQTPTFSASEIKRIKELLANQLHEEKENAKALSFENLVNALYAEEDSRYSYPPEELLKALPQVNASMVKKVHAPLLKRPWTLTIASDPQSVQKAKEKIETLRRHFSPLVSAPFIHAQRSLSAIDVVLSDVPSRQNIEINIGAPLPLTCLEKDFAVFLFGIYVLGNWGGFAGRLMSTVREKEGLTYGIYSRVETATKTEFGFWRIMTFFAPKSVVQGITSTLREVRSIAEGGITQKEYERFKTIIATDETLLGDSLLKKSAELHGYFVNGLNLEEIERFKEQLLGVTRSEVNAALKKYLDPEKLVISAAGPVSGVRSELMAFASKTPSQKKASGKKSRGATKG